MNLQALRASQRPYLFALVLTVLLSALGQYLWQYVWTSIPLIKAQPPGVYLTGIGFSVTFVLWLLAPRRTASGFGGRLFLGALAALWLIVIGLSVHHGDLFTHAVWVYPILLGMLWLKWPDSDEARSAIILSAWVLALILLLARLLELVGIIPMATVSAGMTEYEREHYWLPLSGWLGPEGRWPGPMGHNANTGAIGAYLIVIGIALRRRYAYFFISVGILALLLTMSRGSIIATAAATIVVIALGDYSWNRRLNRTQLVAGVLGFGVLLLALAFAASPNLTGRTDGYWPMFLDLWRSSPWIGVGGTGIASGPEFIRDSNGHNVVIDMLARFGLVATLPLVVALGTSVILALRAAARRVVLPLGIVVTYLMINMTEADEGWAQFSTPWLLLVLATVMAAGIENPQSDASEQE